MHPAAASRNEHLIPSEVQSNDLRLGSRLKVAADRVANGFTQLVQRVCLSEHGRAQSSREESTLRRLFDQDYQFLHAQIMARFEMRLAAVDRFRLSAISHQLSACSPCPVSSYWWFVFSLFASALAPGPLTTELPTAYCLLLTN